MRAADRARRWSGALLLCAALASAAGAADEERVTLNFVNAEIEAVATAIGQMTNRNFLIDPRVKGSVNIVSSQPVPLSAAYDIFLSALRLQGYAAVDSGGVTKILPEAEARMHVRGTTARGAAAGDRLQTQVYVLKYESANQLLQVLRPIISPNNTIAAYPANNSLVITDYADNLRRIDRIIDAIDRPGGGDPVVIPLRYAAAGELADTLNRILAEAPGAPGAGVEPRARTLVAPDARTNNLIVRSDNPARIARVQAMVQQLDVPTGSAGNIHVVYLKNAEAARVAQTLRAIISGDAAAPQSAAAALPNVPGQAAAQPAAQALPATAGMVQADTASNAVIISAPDAVFANLRAVIQKLDVRRAQVFVEALIVEITAEKAAEFGVQWQSIGDLSQSQTQPFGGTNFGGRGSGRNIIDAAGNLSALGTGLNIGLVQGTITLPGVGTVTNLVALARALETDAKTNILSTPNLLTLDNEEARIVVGQNLPFVTGQYAQTGAATSVTPFQTIERRDVGLTLRVKPQISEGGTVRLQIYQEVSSVQDRSFLTGVITNKRSVESTVLVDDGQIVVLGGLVQDGVDTVVEKVPLLGDIPLLGWLFRYETRRQIKTNLMVFLRPMVMRDGAAPGAVTSERYRQMIDFQRSTQPPSQLVLPDLQTPRLPESPADQ